MTRRSLKWLEATYRVNKEADDLEEDPNEQLSRNGHLIGISSEVVLRLNNF
jgi:hypothetical protein